MVEAILAVKKTTPENGDLAGDMLNDANSTDVEDLLQLVPNN